MISILMPVYNGVEFLRESLASVVGQTFDQWELLVGVNGYPEGSPVWQKITQYNSSKIRVLDLHWCHSKPQALNAMVQFARHKWICLLDVDDTWSTVKLERQFGYMSSYQVVGTDAQYFGDRTGGPAIPKMEINHEVFRNINPIVNSSAMFLKEDAYWEDISVEDYDLWCRLAVKGRRFFNVPEVLVSHRIHKDSAFNVNNYDDLLTSIRKTHGFL